MASIDCWGPEGMGGEPLFAGRVQTDGPFADLRDAA